MCEAIAKRLSSTISFPGGENLAHVVQGYEQEWWFPVCAGVIGGTHFPISTPHESQTM